MRVKLVIVCAVLAALSAPAQGEDFLGVTIAPESNSESYKRSLYRHWIDEDGDKLDTRQQVIEIESLIDVTIITKTNGKRVTLR